MNNKNKLNSLLEKNNLSLDIIKSVIKDKNLLSLNDIKNFKNNISYNRSKILQYINGKKSYNEFLAYIDIELNDTKAIINGKKAFPDMPIYENLLLIDTKNLPNLKCNSFYEFIHMVLHPNQTDHYSNEDFVKFQENFSNNFTKNQKIILDNMLGLLKDLHKYPKLNYNNNFFNTSINTIFLSEFFDINNENDRDKLELINNIKDRCGGNENSYINEFDNFLNNYNINNMKINKNIYKNSCDDSDLILDNSNNDDIPIILVKPSSPIINQTQPEIIYNGEDVININDKSKIYTAYVNSESFKDLFDNMYSKYMINEKVNKILKTLKYTLYNNIDQISSYSYLGETVFFIDTRINKYDDYNMLLNDIVKLMREFYKNAISHDEFLNESLIRNLYNYVKSFNYTFQLNDTSTIVYKNNINVNKYWINNMKEYAIRDFKNKLHTNIKNKDLLTSEVIIYMSKYLSFVKQLTFHFEELKRKYEDNNTYSSNINAFIGSMEIDDDNLKRLLDLNVLNEDGLNKFNQFKNFIKNYNNIINIKEDNIHKMLMMIVLFKCGYRFINDDNDDINIIKNINFPRDEFLNFYNKNNLLCNLCNIKFIVKKSEQRIIHTDEYNKYLFLQKTLNIAIDSAKNRINKNDFIVYSAIFEFLSFKKSYDIIDNYNDVLENHKQHCLNTINLTNYTRLSYYNKLKKDFGIIEAFNNELVTMENLNEFLTKIDYNKLILLYINLLKTYNNDDIDIILNDYKIKITEKINNIILDTEYLNKYECYSSVNVEDYDNIKFIILKPIFYDDQSLLDLLEIVYELNEDGIERKSIKNSKLILMLNLLFARKKIGTSYMMNLFLILKNLGYNIDFNSFKAKDYRTLSYNIKIRDLKEKLYRKGYNNQEINEFIIHLANVTDIVFNNKICTQGTQTESICLSTGANELDELELNFNFENNLKLDNNFKRFLNSKIDDIDYIKYKNKYNNSSINITDNDLELDKLLKDLINNDEFTPSNINTIMNYFNPTNNNLENIKLKFLGGVDESQYGRDEIKKFIDVIFKLEDRKLDDEYISKNIKPIMDSIIPKIDNKINVNVTSINNNTDIIKDIKRILYSYKYLDHLIDINSNPNSKEIRENIYKNLEETYKEKFKLNAKIEILNTCNKFFLNVKRISPQLFESMKTNINETMSILLDKLKISYNNYFNVQIKNMNNCLNEIRQSLKLEFKDMNVNDVLDIYSHIKTIFNFSDFVYNDRNQNINNYDISNLNVDDINLML